MSPGEPPSAASFAGVRAVGQLEKLKQSKLSCSDKSGTYVKGRFQCFLVLSEVGEDTAGGPGACSIKAT